jgi:hypothetical protein
MIATPILKLKNGEEIKTLFFDKTKGNVLVGTSQGRILLINSLATNAYLAGNRTIYATIIDGEGKESVTSNLNIQYGLVDKIVELTSAMSITRWISAHKPVGAECYKTISGIFTTPVLWAGEDFGWWGNISWTQTVIPNSKVMVAIRVADSQDNIIDASWLPYESLTSGATTWPINHLSTAGSYIQMKVILESAMNGSNPSVSNLVIPYYSKHASYFFITKLSMKKGTSIQGGLLTATVSTPQNTDVEIGAVGNNSANWNDYISVTPDELFELPEGWGDRIKVGIKLHSYDGESIPVIDEFAVAFDTDINNLIKQ